jgi:hypothetical protein
MPSSVTQRRGDPQHLVLIFVSWRTDHLDDIRLTERQSPGLVKGQRAEAADLFEIFTSANQHSTPRRRRETADNGYWCRDHQRTRTGDHKHNKPAPKPKAPHGNVAGTGGSRGPREERGA